MPLAGPPLTETVDMTKLLERALATKPNEVALLSAATRWTWPLASWPAGCRWA